MKEAIGDLWTYPADIRIITTNGVRNNHGHLVMGAGCALEAKKRYRGLSKTLGDWVKQYGNVPYWSRDFNLITLPTKHHWRDDSDIELIVRGLAIIDNMLETHDVIRGEGPSVCLTRPGCGNGRLLWKDVRPQIEWLNDRYTVIHRDQEW